MLRSESPQAHVLTRRHWVVRHALALLFVGVAFGLTLLLRTIAPRVDFVLFIPAVMFSAWFGGRAAGLTASVLTVALAGSFLLPPGVFVEEVVWLIIAAMVAIGTSTLTAARRRSEEKQAGLLADETTRRHEAESLSQLKTDLLAQVAHELRQPINAITAAIGLLEGGDAPALRNKATSVIARQAEHLRTLVDDLLDLSRAKRGELELRLTDVDLCQVVEDRVHEIAPALAERGISFSVSVPTCPVLLRADATRMRQILSNLLSNAVKYTDRGGTVHLVVERHEDRVVVRVRDTGRGIPPDRLTRIFEMFETGEGEGTGLGIGLAIVKAVAEAHGGSVEATSSGAGRGSEFIVRLPAAGQRAAA